MISTAIEKRTSGSFFRFCGFHSNPAPSSAFKSRIEYVSNAQIWSSPEYGLLSAHTDLGYPRPSTQSDLAWEIAPPRDRLTEGSIVQSSFPNVIPPENTDSAPSDSAIAFSSCFVVRATPRVLRHRSFPAMCRSGWYGSCRSGWEGRGRFRCAADQIASWPSFSLA